MQEMLILEWNGFNMKNQIYEDKAFFNEKEPKETLITFYTREKISNIARQIITHKIDKDSINWAVSLFAKDYELRKSKFSFTIDDKFMICEIDENSEVISIKKVNLMDFINNIFITDSQCYFKIIKITEKSIFFKNF